MPKKKGGTSRSNNQQKATNAIGLDKRQSAQEVAARKKKMTDAAKVQTQRQRFNAARRTR